MSQSIAVRPGPNDALAEIDRRIEALKNAAEDEDPYVSADVGARIARDQEMLAALNVEAELERSTRADELAILQFRQREESTRARERLAGLADQIRVQEQAFAVRRAQIESTVAPPDTDIARNGRTELAAEQARLESARAEYSALLGEYDSTPEAYLADQSETLATVRARRSDLAEMIAAIRADLNEAVDARNQIATERADRARQLGELQKERERTISASASPATSSAE